MRKLIKLSLVMCLIVKAFAGEYRSELDTLSQSGYGVWLDSSPICVDAGTIIVNHTVQRLQDNGLEFVPSERIKPGEWLIRFELNCRVVNETIAFYSDIHLVSYRTETVTGHSLNEPLYLQLFAPNRDRNDFSDIGMSTIDEIITSGKSRIDEFISDLVATLLYEP